MSLPTRSLGRNGPQVPAIGLGLMSFSGWYGQENTSIESSLKFLDKAHEIGERFWDTADVYVGSEDRVGEWFARSGKRSDIFLATKFSLTQGSDGSLIARNDPEYIRECCDKSLKRLRTDTIDLFYCHRVDDKTPIEVTVQAMAELKREGKIRHLGLSECSADTIRRAHAVHPISAYQVEYSPLFLDIESEKTQVLSTCRELGIAIVAYSPVGRGLLAGKIRSLSDMPENDWRRGVAKLTGDNFPKITALVDKIAAIGKRHNASPAQVCLAWVAAQGDEFFSIPGTTTIKYLEENTAAVNVKLTNEEVQELRDYANATELPGDRYPPNMLSMLFNDSVPLV